MKIISIANTKGGSGKTVTAIHLGAALAALGQRVLLLDLDTQHTLTTHFDLDQSGITTSKVLLGGESIADAMSEVRPGLFVVPATADMGNAEVELAVALGGEVRLRRALRRFANEVEVLPDFVLIDCPGTWGAVTRNALLASSSMIVPVNSEPTSVYTAAAIIAAARELGEYHEHSVELLGVLVTRYRQTNIAKSIYDRTHEQWGKSVFSSVIRQAERVNELSAEGGTSEDGAKRHPFGEDYALLAKEVMERVEEK